MLGKRRRLAADARVGVFVRLGRRLTLKPSTLEVSGKSLEESGCVVEWDSMASPSKNTRHAWRSCASDCARPTAPATKRWCPASAPRGAPWGPPGKPPWQPRAPRRMPQPRRPSPLPGRHPAPPWEFLRARRRGFSVHEQVHQALAILGAPAAPKLISSAYQAFFAKPMVTTKPASLRRDGGTRHGIRRDPSDTPSGSGQSAYLRGLFMSPETLYCARPRCSSTVWWARQPSGNFGGTSR